MRASFFYSDNLLNLIVESQGSRGLIQQALILHAQ